MFWSQISSFYLQLITNRAGTFLHFQTRITGVYMIIHCHIHWLWQILGKHVKWGLSKQYSGYRERCGVRSVAYNPFPVGNGPIRSQRWYMLITRATMQKECTDYARWHFWTMWNWVDVTHDEFVKRFSYDSDKSDRSRICFGKQLKYQPIRVNFWLTLEMLLLECNWRYLFEEEEKTYCK